MCLRHLFRPRGRLAQFDDMIPFAQSSTTAKVGAASARSELLEQSVDAATLEFGEQEVGREECVTEQHVAGLRVIEQRAQQDLFVVTLALRRAGSGVEDGAAGQTQEPGRGHS